jgi:hypothetical protein
MKAAFRTGTYAERNRLRRWLISAAGVILVIAAGLAPASATAWRGHGNHRGRNLGAVCAPSRAAIAHPRWRRHREKPLG